MKKIFIISFLVSILVSSICNAAFLTEADLESCENGRSFLLKSRCEKVSGETCYKVPKNYDCNYFRVSNVSVDDFSKPVFSKNEIEACSGEADCQSKIAAKTCSDTSEKALIGEGYTEVYCSKKTGFAQKLVPKAKKDLALKASYDALITSEKADAKAKRDEVKALKAKLRNGDLTDNEIKKVLRFLLRNI